MKMDNKICQLLGIKYPLIQGGMAWVSESTLAAAVSNAGGLGIIAGGSAPIIYLREQIRNARQLTDKPFGVNIMLMSHNAEDLAALVVEEKVAVVTTGAGNPAKFAEQWKAAGIKIIPVIPSVALAKRMERSGADAIIAEGTESGGHIGENTTMCLVPQVVDAVSVPVIAAGGIADKRGVRAAFALGAQGVQCGTVFLAAAETQIHQNYKDLVLKAKDTDSIVTGRFTGHPCRAVKTKFAKGLLDLEKYGCTPEEFENLTLGSLRKAAVDGNIDEGSFLCGAIAGLVNEMRPCADIIKSLFE